LPNYTSFKSSVSWITISEECGKITGLWFRRAKRNSSTGLLREARRQVIEYLTGRRRSFDLPLDTSSAGRFVNSVLSVIKEIPYGQVIAYSDVAERLGTASRAAGNGCSKNPIPVIIPCHRVVRKDGKPGGFSSGLGIKKKLLAIEGGNRD
jgi:methylated-DNA-[protein]-cysteine S-methyltransferase